MRGAGWADETRIDVLLARGMHMYMCMCNIYMDMYNMTTYNIWMLTNMYYNSTMCNSNMCNILCLRMGSVQPPCGPLARRYSEPGGVTQTSSVGRFAAPVACACGS